MTKHKTRKSILKRFKITGSGKVIRSHQAIRHRHSHKSKRRIRTFAEPVKLSNRQAKFVKNMLNK
jgi:large subunit ribosomal protein L35